MKKYVCTVCGYIAEGSIPDFCPVCKAPASKFIEKTDNSYVTEHVVGIAKDAPEDIIQGLRENFNGECSEVGMYLAMSRVADREGYPEIAEAWKRYAFEEAEHASKFAELLGEVLTDSTKKNLQMRVDAESGACAGKMELAKKAKALNLDAIHDTVHEMAKDEARHGRGMQGLLDRYFAQHAGMSQIMKNVFIRIVHPLTDLRHFLYLSQRSVRLFQLAFHVASLGDVAILAEHHVIIRMHDTFKIINIFL